MMYEIMVRISVKKDEDAKEANRKLSEDSRTRENAINASARSTDPQEKRGKKPGLANFIKKIEIAPSKLKRHTVIIIKREIPRNFPRIYCCRETGRARTMYIVLLSRSLAIRSMPTNKTRSKPENETAESDISTATFPISRGTIPEMKKTAPIRRRAINDMP
jgi:hypothetical protein